MGEVGFLFNFENKQIVIFIESKKVKLNCIIGFVHHFNPKNVSEFSNISKELKYSPHIYLENARMPYAKISLSQTTSLYFEDLTLWLEPYLYKHIWELLHLQQYSKKIILDNVNSIIELLEL